MEVFSYLVNGLRAKDIADLLAISSKEVDNHRASLMRKLHVQDLVGLLNFWLNNLGEEGLAGVRSALGPRLPHRPPRAAADPPEDPYYKIE